MKHKLLVFIIALVLATMSFLNIVQATVWSAPTITGDWVSINQSNAKTNTTTDTGTALFVYETSNFTGIKQIFNFNTFNAGRNSLLGFSGENHFYIRVGLFTNDSEPHFYMNYGDALEIAVGSSWFGGWNWRNFIYYNGSDGTHKHASAAYGIPFNVTVYMNKINDTTLSINYRYYVKMYGSLGAIESPFEGFYLQTTFYTVPAGAFSQDLLVKMWIGHSGNGNIDCDLAESPGYYAPEGGTFGPNPPINLIPEPLRSIISMVGDGISFVIGMLMILGGFIAQFTPILPFMFLFWAIDVVITSAQSGSIKPIGDWLMQLYEFALTLWDLLIHFGQLIWDVITFWT